MRPAWSLVLVNRGILPTGSVCHPASYVQRWRMRCDDDDTCCWLPRPLGTSQPRVSFYRVPFQTRIDASLPNPLHQRSVPSATPRPQFNGPASPEPWGSGQPVSQGWPGGLGAFDRGALLGR